MRKIRVAVIGATGSVGTSVLDICERFPEHFEVTALASAFNSRKLLELIEKFKPKFAYLKTPDRKTAASVKKTGACLLSGEDGLTAFSTLQDVDHVVFASSGTDAIKALQKALSADKDVSLANKESIVAAGPWVMPLVRRGDQLRPVDSEHSAIWQCLRDEPSKNVSKILLTASGGPFRDWTLSEMQNITPDDALKHPVWEMGSKVTVDSATLMNKGIECIEAMQLFGQPAKNVGAVVHPKSLVHGMVIFSDATMKMLFSRPDMRLPSAAALAWPERLDLNDAEDLTLPPLSDWTLEFREPDHERFPCLQLALSAGEKGGAFPALLVGADETAVDAFLTGKIHFLSIANIIERTLEKYSGSAPSTVEDAVELIAEGKRLASELIEAES